MTAREPSIIPASAFRLTINCTYVCPSLVTYVAQSWKELVLIDSLTALPALDFLTNPTRGLFAFCSFSGSVFFSAFGSFFSTPGTSWFLLRRSYRNNLHCLVKTPCKFLTEVR